MLFSVQKPLPEIHDREQSCNGGQTPVSITVFATVAAPCNGGRHCSRTLQRGTDPGFDHGCSQSLAAASVMSRRARASVRAAALVGLAAILVAASAVLPARVAAGALAAVTKSSEAVFPGIPAGEPAAPSARYPETVIEHVENVEGAKLAETIRLTGGTPGGAAGFRIDFTNVKISAYAVKSLTVRARVPQSVKEISLSADGGETDIGRYYIAGYEREKWTEFSFYSGGINFVSGFDMPDLGVNNGQLGTLTVNFQAADVTADGAGGSSGTSSGAGEGQSEGETPSIYVDYVSVTLDNAVKGGDLRLTYDGPDSLDQTAGKPLVIGDFSAFDAFEGAARPVAIRWEGTPGTDAAGNAVEGGPYTLVLEAKNSFEETVTKKITLTVRPKDNVPPVIEIFTDTIRARAGTYAKMNVSAKDNEDPVDAVLSWSEGAVDAKGRLLPGEHTLTVTASDLTGNTSEKSVKVIAINDADDPGDVLPVTRDESKIMFALPDFAIALIIAAAGMAVLICAAVLSIRFKKKADGTLTTEKPAGEADENNGAE